MFAAEGLIIVEKHLFFKSHNNAHFFFWSEARTPWSTLSLRQDKTEAGKMKKKIISGFAQTHLADIYSGDDISAALWWINVINVQTLWCLFTEECSLLLPLASQICLKGSFQTGTISRCPPPSTPHPSCRQNGKNEGGARKERSLPWDRFSLSGEQRASCFRLMREL